MIRFAARTPDEIRTLVTMMTDEELLDLMLYFRLGLFYFVAELSGALDVLDSRPER